MLLLRHSFDLISAGFHSYAKELRARRDPDRNFDALRRYVDRYPLDILTHPCIDAFPLPTERLVTLAIERGFSLEVNNTNLAVGKTDVERLKEMVRGAVARKARLVCNSDGHTFLEIGECGLVRRVIEEDLGLPMEGTFPINFDEGSLARFLDERAALRGRGA